MIHLVCGPIGAGKTTIAIKIAEEYGAIRFSKDEWLSKLFAPDAPDGLLEESVDEIASWASEKYQRCRGQIWLVCEQLIKQGIIIVLDGAAANKEQRDQIRKKAENHNTEFQLHYVTASSETRRKRILERNTDRGKTYSLDVTQGMFDFMEQYFEPPVGEELIGTSIVNT